MLPTWNQLARNNATHKRRKENRAAQVRGHPQRRALVIRVISDRKPKKPNSAKRKIAKVRVHTTRRMINCYVPGMGHNLRPYALVWVRGGRRKDLPGIQYHLMRGKFDFSWEERIKRGSRKTKFGHPSKKQLFGFLADTSSQTITKDADNVEDDGDDNDNG